MTRLETVMRDPAVEAHWDFKWDLTHWIGPITLTINLLLAIPVSKWGPRRADQRGSIRVGMIGLIILGGLTTILTSPAR